jgi:hypothetical protein
MVCYSPFVRNYIYEHTLKFMTDMALVFIPVFRVLSYSCVVSIWFLSWSELIVYEDCYISTLACFIYVLESTWICNNLPILSLLCRHHHCIITKRHVAILKLAILKPAILNVKFRYCFGLCFKKSFFLFSLIVQQVACVFMRGRKSYD